MGKSPHDSYLPEGISDSDSNPHREQAGFHRIIPNLFLIFVYTWKVQGGTK